MIDSEKKLITQQQLHQDKAQNNMKSDNLSNLRILIQHFMRNRGVELNLKIVTTIQIKRLQMSTIDTIQAMKKARRRLRTTLKVVNGLKTSGINLTLINNKKRSLISTMIFIRQRHASSMKSTNVETGILQINNLKTQTISILELNINNNSSHSRIGRITKNKQKINKPKMISISSIIMLMKRRCVGGRRNTIRKRIGKGATLRSSKNTGLTLRSILKLINLINLL